MKLKSKNVKKKKKPDGIFNYFFGLASKKGQFWDCLIYKDRTSGHFPHKQSVTMSCRHNWLLFYGHVLSKNGSIALLVGREVSNIDSSNTVLEPFAAGPKKTTTTII